MERIRKCAACRYCRVRSAVQTTAVLLVGVIIIISMMIGRGNL